MAHEEARPFDIRRTVLGHLETFDSDSQDWITLWQAEGLQIATHQEFSPAHTSQRQQPSTAVVLMTPRARPDQIVQNRSAFLLQRSELVEFAKQVLQVFA